MNDAKRAARSCIKCGKPDSADWYCAAHGHCRACSLETCNRHVRPVDDAERAVKEAHERVEEVRRAVHLNYSKWPLFDKMIDEANASIDRAIEAVRAEGAKFKTLALERYEIIGAIAHEKDELRAKANAAECSLRAESHRADRQRRDENEAIARLHQTHYIAHMLTEPPFWKLIPWKKGKYSGPDGNRWATAIRARIGKEGE